MAECRFIAASGALGVGVHEDSLVAALDTQPHFIASDAGSTDAGPFALGLGVGAFPREAIRHDLGAILRASRRAGVPALVGSVGTAGADVHVDAFMDVVHEVAGAEGMRLRVAAIRAEQPVETVAAMFREGRVRALDNAPPLDEAGILRSTRIVGMMGVEPLQAALAEGVDLVVAGRCSDPALFAAMPIAMGLPEGLAWHAGKVVECGTSVCETSGPGVITGVIRDDEAVIRPVGPGRRCTPQSVAAHSLYENADPFIFRESSGELDIGDATYEQLDEFAVRIRGSTFRRAERPTVKLEGAEQAGFQTIMVGGVRDPFILAGFDAWMEHVRERVRVAVERAFGATVAALGSRIDYHIYGRDAVMGRNDPARMEVPHEVGIVVEATAPTQEMATKLAQLTRQPLLHTPVAKWKGSITGFACLHNPACIERGPVFRFNLNHVALPDSPVSMFRTTFETVGAG